MFATSFTSIAVFGCELLLAEIQHTSTIITYCEQELATQTGIQAGACSQHIFDEQRFGFPKSLLVSDIRFWRSKYWPFTELSTNPLLKSF